MQMQALPTAEVSAAQEEAEDYMESDMPDNKKTHPFQVRPAIYNRCHHF